MHPEIYDRSVSLQASRKGYAYNRYKGVISFPNKQFNMHLSFFNFSVTLLTPGCYLEANNEKTPFSKELCEIILSCKGSLIAESYLEI